MQRAQEQAENGLALAIEARIRFAADYYEVLGKIQTVRGDLTTAARSFQESITIRTRVGYAGGCLRSLLGLGLAYQLQGDLDSANRTFGRALELSTTIDACPEVVATFRHVASLKLEMGDDAGADASLQRAFAIIEQEGIQDTLEYAPALLVLSDLQAFNGNMEGALQSTGQVLECPRTLETEIEARLRGASLEIALHQLDAAEAHARDGLRLARGLGSPRLVSLAERALASVAASRPGRCGVPDQNVADTR
ncbi:MAG: tetratricopeptide repeat protein [Chloroflexi bacterium]|nr:tetratricopeptide repeat protein [Chloroflexota bacterium]